MLFGPLVHTLRPHQTPVTHPIGGHNPRDGGQEALLTQFHTVQLHAAAAE